MNYTKLLLYESKYDITITRIPLFYRSIVITMILFWNTSYFVIARTQNHFSPPIMGWSSWNTYRVDINDTLICKQANALISTELKNAGYNYVNIDDGFFGWRDDKGEIHTHSQRFPNGLKCIAKYIHSLGLKAGIYSDAGSNTCGSIYDEDKNGVGVGLYGHESQDAWLYFKNWGFDFIKVDYCGAIELNLDEQKRYTKIRKAIDNIGCKNVSINICRWAFPGIWAKNLASSWRISSDIRPEWRSVKHIIDMNLYLSAYAGNGHYNDMDMLEISRGLKPYEEEVHFGMWCMMSSPLLIGCDLTKIQESSLHLLKNKELIAINQDSLGLQAYVVQHSDSSGYVLVKDIEHRRGIVRAVALYNPSDSVCHFSVLLSTLELKGKATVRDLIQHKDVTDKVIYSKNSTEEQSIIYAVPAHSIRIYRVEAEDRIVPTLYEAEWALLPCYDNLGKTKKPLSYVPMKGSSGNIIVSNLGGRKENIAIWNNVYCEDSGTYKMSIRYISKEGRKLEVIVNGIKHSFNKLPDNGIISSITLSIKLKKGNNTITMGSPYCWAPDIDCFTIKK